MHGQHVSPASLSFTVIRLVQSFHLQFGDFVVSVGRDEGSGSRAEEEEME